jgi:prepilin-type N-terminal cleavage/methylation domain-containing protein
MKMFRKDEGFTLVELMVVVLIIGILVAIAVPIFNAAKAGAQTKTCYANMRTVAGAYQTWSADNPAGLPVANQNWAGVIGALVPDYVKTTPVCPNASAYSATFANGTPTISCANAAHTQTF